MVLAGGTDMRDEALVAIMNNPLDLAIARDRHWYRIPVSSVERMLSGRWPPAYLAFYQTKIFGSEAYGVHWYAPVREIRRVFRWELFPDQPPDEQSRRQYYKVSIGELQRLPRSIWSRRFRRIVFIPTTWSKLTAAVEINDLYDGSPLEDRLWSELKRLSVDAERQELVTTASSNYFLDFAVYCLAGNLAIETDGDSWHADPQQIPADNLRDNDLKTLGWSVLRFNTYHIQETMTEYCLPTITENIDRLGGLDVGNRATGRIIGQPAPGGERQLGLFNQLPSEED